MRWQDMTPGEAYALAGDPRVKVTVLDTPADVRSRARVRVRFETGVTAGRVCELPSRRIGAPWGGGGPAKPAARRRKPDATVLLLSRPARVGDTVMLDETDELLWKVDAVDEDRGAATISTRIFEQPHTRSAALNRLQVRGKPRTRARVDTGPPRRIDAPVDYFADDAGERLRPITPRRELDEVMDDVLFTRACVRQYDRRLGAGEPGPALDRLREEVRRAGYIVRKERADEYARIRVRGRFDIVLAHKPSAEAPAMINGLFFPAPRSARRRPGSGRRRAA